MSFHSRCFEKNTCVLIRRVVVLDSYLKMLKTDLVNRSMDRGRRITSNGQRDLDQVAGRITVAAA
jgi:ribosomal protein S19E (S16A)